MFSALALLVFSVEPVWSRPSTRQLKRADVPADISEWTAFGNSYASGIGAGNNVAPGQVFDGSYPWQMNYDDLRIGNANNRVFHDLAFSGYNIAKAIATVKKIGRPEMVTLQMGISCILDLPSSSDKCLGGNDAGFYNVITAYVYRFGAKEAGNCDVALQNFQDNLYAPLKEVFISLGFCPNYMNSFISEIY